MIKVVLPRLCRESLDHFCSSFQTLRADSAVVCQLDKPLDPSWGAHRFREEIERLSREQARTIGGAVANLGYMAPDESAAYDFRRAKILHLIEDLKQLENPA
jgi:hypothetical protein